MKPIPFRSEFHDESKSATRISISLPVPFISQKRLKTQRSTLTLTQTLTQRPTLTRIGSQPKIKNNSPKGIIFLKMNFENCNFREAICNFKKNSNFREAICNFEK
jgi:hypothetical protein